MKRKTKKTNATPKVATAKSTKNYSLPDEVHEQFTKVASLRDLRDTFIRLSPFGAYRFAARTSLEATKENRKAWEMVRKIYPETKGMEMSYNGWTKELTKLDK